MALGKEWELDKGAYGELATSTKAPEINALFQYNINPDIVNTFTNGSATITQENSQAVIASGSDTTCFGKLETRDFMQFQPGVGGMAVFSGVFSNPITNSQLLIGYGSAENGFFFGYDNTSFGIHRHNAGRLEVRRITITDFATADGTITITLDGAVKVITVTNFATQWETIEKVVNKIVAEDFSSVDGGWFVYKYDNTSIDFYSYNAKVFAGAFTYAAGTTGTTATGGITQTIAGALGTDDFVAQADWNGHKLLTNSYPGHFLLNPQLGNVFKIKIQWPFGVVKFYIENPVNGDFILLHTIRYPMTSTIPSLVNASLPMSMIASKSSAAATNISVASGSLGAFTEGARVDRPTLRGSAIQSLAGLTTEVPILSIHNPYLYQGLTNRTVLVIDFLTISNEVGTKSTTFKVYKNISLSGPTSWVANNLNTSAVVVDIASTGVTIVDEPLGSFTVAKEDADRLFLTPFDYKLLPGETVTVTAESINAATVKVGLSWKVKI